MQPMNEYSKYTKIKFRATLVHSFPSTCARNNFPNINTKLFATETVHTMHVGAMLFLSASFIVIFRDVVAATDA